LLFINIVNGIFGVVRNIDEQLRFIAEKLVEILC